MRIAMCVPTYNNARLVEELFEECANRYKKFDIDILFFDSSDNCETKTVYDKYADNTNVFYFDYAQKVSKLDYNSQSNTKMYMALKSIANNSSYDYVWLCTDALRFSDSLLSRIVQACENKHDYIVIDDTINGNADVERYNDYNLFFNQYAGKMTCTGFTIVRRTTVLSDVDWNRYEVNYLRPDTVNFSHVCFYAERASELNSFDVIVLNSQAGEVNGSSYKIRSKWFNNGLKIFFEYWPAAIHRLPDCFTEKEEMIENYYKFSNYSKTNLLPYRAYGALSEDFRSKFEKRLMEWMGCSTDELNAVMRLSPDEAMKVIEENKERFRRFCQSHSSLYIYGAGAVAKRKSIILDRIEQRFDGFLVTKCDNRTEHLNGHSVIQFDDSLYTMGKTGIILGLGDKNKKEVMSSVLKGINGADIYDEDLDMLLF